MQTTVTHSAQTRRYWRLRPEPIPLWPWGALLLLGLALLFLWGLLRTAGWIEDSVREQVAERLGGFNITLDDIQADGQLLAIDAGSRTAAEAERIREIAEATRCDTWSGELICPRRVEVNHQSIDKPSPAIDEPVATASLARAHPFEFRVDTNRVRLSGELASEDQRRAVLKRAESLFDSVTDDLTVSGDSAGTAHDAAIERALLSLQPLTRGTATWTGDALSVTGLVPASSEQAVGVAFASLDNAPPLGELTLSIAKEADTCNQEFAQQLATSTINFETASARIDSGSIALLASLADLANRCPGNLRIEGHTDSVGAEDTNQRLSEARAQAVADALTDAGVTASRLRAIGLGEQQPVADNASAAGRAQNRRIVIQIDSAQG